MITKRIEASRLVSIEGDSTSTIKEDSKAAEVLSVFASKLRSERIADLVEIEESLVDKDLEEKLMKSEVSEIFNTKCVSVGKYRTGQIFKTKNGVVVFINSNVNLDGIDHIAISRFN